MSNCPSRNMDKKKRLVFQLDTPYSVSSWPQVSPENQETILELLCSLLSPLGNHRLEHASQSKGKRLKKRKRQVLLETTPPSPPIPEISSYVDVGLTAVTCGLQTATTGLKGCEAVTPSSGNPGLEATKSGTHPYSIIIVARSGQPSALNSHFPQLVATASKQQHSPISLVGLSKSCQDRLSSALAIPRISCIGIREGAPGSKALEDFARAHVPVVQVEWMEEARQGRHKETNVNAVETFIGPPRRKKLDGVKAQSQVSVGDL
ncbi:hypothetical protein F4778DRAFT_739189 [Xylariomycetidae sp. FL2044]|nr:hypothetical protein F4778DRAFT_739189 [Xylariomycetidae sp. FL2044]